jgi:photosystem II stability/assembly factor-like uncharacterized protein
MGAYPDGMQRLTLLASIAAALLALALPSVAAAPTSWHEGKGVTGSFTALRAASSFVAVAGANDGRLIRTDDGGRTWTETTPPSTAGLRDIATSDGDTVYTLDARNSVKRTKDGGSTWDEPVDASALRPRGLVAWTGGHLLIVGSKSLSLSSDSGDKYTDVTPNLATTDAFRGGRRGGGVVVVYGPRTLLVSDPGAKTWKHVKLPRLEKGDALIGADFIAPRVGFVLTSFRHVYRTRDAGHHWTDLLGTGGAGADMSFTDEYNGWLAAPGFASRFDGYVLHTSDGGSTWRPQPVSPRFLSKVAAMDDGAFAIGNEGSAMFMTHNFGDAGKRMTVGFRPVPRRARRGGTVTIRGRVDPGQRGVGVAVSMRSARRWIVRYVTTGEDGVFVASFTVQRRAAFVAQVATGSGHTSAATPPVFVPVGK